MHVEVEGNRVRVRGEVALGDAMLQHVADRLNSLVAASPVVELDLPEVTFIDSTGLGVIVAASRSAQAAGGRLHIVAASDRVRALIELTQLHQVLSVAATSG